MCSLTWKRISGRVHEDLILFARGLIPSIACTKETSFALKSTSVWPAEAAVKNAVDKSAVGSIVISTSHVQGNAVRRPPQRASVGHGRCCHLLDRRMLTSMCRSPAPLFLSWHRRYSLAGASSWKVASWTSPVGSTRCLSSGDRADRDIEERLQAFPFADGEGDDQDKEKERLLSVKGGMQDGVVDQSKNFTEEFGGGGEDESGDVKEQAKRIGENGSKRGEVDNEREDEEAGSEALFLAAKARFRKEFERRIVNWESIDVNLPTFPFYVNDTTKELLVDCVAAHLKQPAFAGFGSGLPSSNRRMLLRGQPGTELYQEKLVEAVARYLEASLLVIDSTVLSPDDFGNQESSSESDVEGGEESHFDEWGQSDSKWQGKDSGMDSSNEETEDLEAEKGSRDEIYNLPVVTLLGVTSESADGIRRKLMEVHNGTGGSDCNDHQGDYSDGNFTFKKGDRVRYTGGKDAGTSKRKLIDSETDAIGIGALLGREALKVGQRGRVVSVPKNMTGKVGVKFERHSSQSDSLSKGDTKCEESQKAYNSLIEWCDSCDLESDDVASRVHAEDWTASIAALAEVASTTEPLIIYLPDAGKWFERAVSMEQRQDFLLQLENKFDQLSGPVVIIAGRTDEGGNDVDDRSKLKTHLEDIRHRMNIKSSSNFSVQELPDAEHIYELFLNTVHISPPQDGEALQSWNDQLILHKGIREAKWNGRLLGEVLELHNMECDDLNLLDLYCLHLSTAKAETIVGWARNHLLASCVSTPSTSNGKLMIPRDSLERALTRLRDNDSKKSQPVTKDYKAVAEDEYEKALISAVIPPQEVGVKFDHIGSLENVKQALRELVMLPLQRPELFAKGNLTRPCKGVLLFGPPGTGKTLLAKAVATEAGANFINITGSTITSKWFGDAEKLTKALFSLAKKLSPAVIFVDEVDSLLGARGGSSEHEATRKTRNEFMAAWDGLRSKDNERVLVLAATNRPFDLDDAVIRRLPRRILVDLPTAENRVKILRVILVDEELEPNFDFEGLARMTEGYSGSDLKNLSIAAAYRPIRELLDAEAKAQAAAGGGLETSSQQHFNRGSGSPKAVIRPLCLDDFKEGMSQVGASIAYDASSMNELRRWNEQYGERGNRKRPSFGFIV